MNRIAEDCFAPLGMSPSQAFVLMNVIQRPGIAIGELASMLMLAPSTVTRLVESLDKQGLTKKVTEGRSSIVFAKEEAFLLKEQFESCYTAMYKRYVSILGEKQSKQLAELNFKASLKMNADGLD
jgi:DNA-binding MarR family transcriptional regulator